MLNLAALTGWEPILAGVILVLIGLRLRWRPEDLWRMQRAQLRRMGVEGAERGARWQAHWAWRTGMLLVLGMAAILFGVYKLAHPDAPPQDTREEAPVHTYPTPDPEAGRRLHERATR